MENNQKHEYMMLGRLQSDCDYFLGNGNGFEKHLWAGSVQEQINEMQSIFDSLVEKPEWLTKEQIQEYKSKMEKKLNSN